MFKFILWLLLLFPLHTAAEFKTSSITAPEQLYVTETQSLKTIGSATFSVLLWDIYRAKLMTSSGQYPLKGTSNKLIFEINYFADISSEDLVKRTEEQWQHIGLSKQQYQAYLPQLKQLWPNIQDGDTLSLLIKEQQSHFYFNQRYIGTVTSPQFGQQFIDIWLSPRTSQPGLRAQLLGGKDD